MQIIISNTFLCLTSVASVYDKRHFVAKGVLFGLAKKNFPADQSVFPNLVTNINGRTALPLLHMHDNSCVIPLFSLYPISKSVPYEKALLASFIFLWAKAISCIASCYT